MKFIQFTSDKEKRFVLNPDHISEMVENGDDECVIIMKNGVEYKVATKFEELLRSVNDSINQEITLV